MKNPIDIDAYIFSFPEEAQKLLKQMRQVIHEVAPQATEIISYGMPAFKFKGMLVYFSAYEHHIGFYPLPSAIAKFKDELSIYKSAKGSVQFPINKPLPLTLIKRMVEFRVIENLQKEKK